MPSCNSTGGQNQNEGNEPVTINDTCLCSTTPTPQSAAIEVVGYAPDGRERFAPLSASRRLTPDGARRMAVRLLEAAHRIDRA